jgi:hypothetical protein
LTWPGYLILHKKNLKHLLTACQLPLQHGEEESISRGVVTRVSGEGRRVRGKIFVPTLTRELPGPSLSLEEILKKSVRGSPKH